MSRLDHERATNILAEVSELPLKQRAAFLDSTCAGEPELRREVEELLACADGASTAFAAASQQIVQPDPEQIGPYSILEPIGEGGMAIVYRASQQRPVKRIVAVKLIKLGMDTRQFVARFEAERQALAMMDHPNVARIFDAGATDIGRPYFVMEYVSGRPILDYCDERKLATRQRLELFATVCDAVEHAHRKGILHRDIKSSNVLVAEVDGKAFPKVIDFGIAKALQQPLIDRTLQTEQGQLIGTPEYMSPEQASGGLDVDTRADVYSLGVLLYELIAGVHPIGSDVLRSGGFEQVQRHIRETEAPRPSTRLSTLASVDATRIAQRRRVELPTLIRNLRSELEWIPLKAMRKDREQRYSSAAELADDVDNYLHARPLRAGPESAGYKLRKFIRRNRVTTLAGVVVVSVLLIAAGVSIAFALSERRQRQVAETARREVEQVAQFQEEQFHAIDPPAMGLRLRADLLDKVRAVAERGKLPPDQIDARVAELEQLIAGSDFTGMALDTLQGSYFQPALAAIERQFPNQPPIQARLFQTLATTLRQLGNREAASDPQEKALEIRRRELGNMHVDTLGTVFGLGLLRREQGKLDEAEPLLRESLDGFRLVLGAEHDDTITAMSTYATLLRMRGELDRSEALLREAVELRRRLLGRDQPNSIAAIVDLGKLLEGRGKLLEAESLAREALDRSRRLHGDEHPDTAEYTMNLGAVLKAQGKLDEAEPYLKQALAAQRRLLGDHHPATLTASSNMGLLLRAQGKLEEAEGYYREVLEKRRRLLGDDHASTLTVMHNLAVLLHNQGKLDEAEALYRATIEKRRRLGPNHPDLLITTSRLSQLLIERGQFSEAEIFCQEALRGQREVLGEQHQDTLTSVRRMGQLLYAQHKPAEAIGLLAPAEPACRRVFADGNIPGLGAFLSILGKSRAAVGEFDAAESNLNEAHSIFTQSKAATHQQRVEVLAGLIELYEARHAAEPNRGYDAKAAGRRIELQQLQATTRPTTAPSLM